MRQFNTKKFQYWLLKSAYKMAPFDIKGNLRIDSKQIKNADILSCLITSNRKNDVEMLLEDLSLQSLNKDQLEVVLLTDGRSDEFQHMVDCYKNKLNIVYVNLTESIKSLSNLRNISIELSSGQMIMFIDDDARLFDVHSLQKAVDIFKKSNTDVIVPQANALYGLVKEKYDFLDKFSFTTRCIFYQREVLEQLGGFKNNMNSYEDIELSIRLMLKNYKIIQTNSINYYHPPLYFYSMQKPLSIGQSIFQLRQHYSFLVWLFVYLNSLRFLIYFCLPFGSFRQWFSISLGVLIYPFTKNSYFYREN